MKKVAFILTLVLAIYASAGMAQDVGNPAPDFTYDVLDGGTFTLSDYAGKVVVIFAFGHSCPYCVGSAPLVQEHLVNPYTANDNYVIVGIDLWNGSSGSVTTFKNNTNLTIPLLLQGGSFGSSYGTVHDRLLVISSAGILVHKENTPAANDYADVANVVDIELGQVTSIENAVDQDNSLQVFPNPVTGNIVNLSFELSKPGLVSTKVISTDGRTLIQSSSTEYSQGANELSVKIGDLSAGVYYVVIDIEGKQTFRKILVN